MAEQWYYAQGHERKGPVEASALKALADAGVVTGDTLVWREGLADWEPAFRHVPGLVPPVRGAPPPPPPRSRSAGEDRPGAVRRDVDGSPGGYHEQVGFAEAFRRFFRNYVNFSGRSNRGEFWWAVLAVILVGVVAGVVDGALFGAETAMQPVSNLWSLATFIPSLALAVRRLHDTDRSGWWIVAPAALGIAAALLVIPELASGNVPVLAMLVGLAALATWVMLVVWYCQRGTSGPNRFG